MFCPRCGSSQSEELRFCKTCGADLSAALQVITAKEPGESFDWSRTWVAEMFMSQQERKRQHAEIERQRGITPEMKRYTEIKAGVIVSSVGIAIGIFLYVFMEGLISSGKVSAPDAAILSHIWVAGVIPLLVGLALVLNGVIVSKKLVEAANRGSRLDLEGMEAELKPRSLGAVETNEFLDSPFSVTEQTTKHLSGSSKKR